jgi:hypothetical protein
MESTINNLDDMFRELRMPSNGWDLILIGDGSGSKWDNPGGWACSMIMKSRETKEVHYFTPLVGAVSRGSINWLEAVPYWHCLRHHYYHMDGKELCADGGVDVFIVSDSEWVVKTMSGRQSARTHDDMVMLFQYYRQHGYRMQWRHVKRDVIKMNKIVDMLAVNAREYISDMEYPSVSKEFPPHGE